MVCPECGGMLIVRDTQSVNDEVLRKRICEKCGNTIYTFETVSEYGEYIKKLMRKVKYEKKKRRAAHGEKA